MEAQIALEGRHRSAARPSTSNRPARYVSKRPALKRAFAGLARELQSPIASMSLLLELMQVDERAQNMASSGGMAEDASVPLEALGRRIVTLLEDLRETGNPFGLRPGLADLAVIVQRAISARHPVIEARRLHVSVDALAPLVVNGDPRLLVKAIGDLLDLVIQHAPDGAGIAFVVELDGARATIGLTCRRGELPTPDLASAFYPLPGSGTGLTSLEPWLARTIIEHHGGNVVSANMDVPKSFGLTITLPGRLA